MPWPYPHGVTVTVHRAGAKNPRTQERGPETPHELEHCAYDRGTTSGEDDVAGKATTTAPRVFAAYDADVDPETDELEVPGTSGRWHVDGEVLRHRSSLTGTEACSEIGLTRRKGAR